MDRKQIILASLAPANCALHTPVQVQKLLFLIDKNISQELGGPHFDFQPYNYGPFDKTIYNTLQELELDGLVEIVPVHTWRECKLSNEGQRIGQQWLNKLQPDIKEFIIKASEFVRKLSFAQLVSAIYKAYPDMRVNSVFQE